MTRDTAANLAHRRGFTLIEATISLLIVSVMLVSSLSLLGSAAKSHRVQADEQDGTLLARQLLDEIVQHAYEEPVDTPTPGTAEPGENTGDRSQFDDVDDYMAWLSTPPVDRKGSALPNYDGWTREAVVKWVAPADLAVVASDSGLFRVIVIATSPTGRRAEVSALRARTGVSEWSTYDKTYTSLTEIELQTDGDDTRLVAGVSLVNEPRQTVLDNGDFELGATQWDATSGTLTARSDGPHSGRSYVRVSDRVEAHNALRQYVGLESGVPYDAETWVRAATNGVTFTLRIKVVTPNGSFDDEVDTGPIGTDWTRVSARLTVNYTGVPSASMLRVQTLSDLGPIDVDDVVLTRGK